MAQLWKFDFPEPNMIELSPEVASINRFPGLGNYGHKGIYSIVDSFAVDIIRKETGGREVDEREVVVIVGPPGSGKTKVKEEKDKAVLKLQKALGTSGKDITVASKTWEIDGEETARNKGLITTPNEEPFSDFELSRSNDELRLSVARAIQESDITTVELPAVTSAFVDGELRGRQLGGTVMYDLAHRRGEFSQLPNYRVRYIGLVGGPLLRHVMVYHRDFIRSARDLSEAQHISWLFGKEIPKNEEEWSMIKRDGASVQQIRTVDRAVDSLMTELSSRNKIDVPFKEYWRLSLAMSRGKSGYGKTFDRGLLISDPEHLDANSFASALQAEKFFYESDFEAAVKGRIAFRATGLALLIRYILQANLAVPTEDVLIGYNNPTIEDLKLPDVKALANFMKERKGRRPFTGS